MIDKLEWASLVVVLLALMGLVVVPIGVYLTVKLATYAYYSGRRTARWDGLVDDEEDE